MPIGDPEPRIEWSKLRAPLPWQHRLENSSLVIPRAAQQDSGQYICNASSPAGYAEVFVTLDVESKWVAGGRGGPGSLLPSPLSPPPPLWASPILSFSLSFLCTWPSPSPRQPSRPDLHWGPSSLRPSTHPPLQLLLGSVVLPFPWMCPPACPISVLIRFYFSLLRLSFILFSSSIPSLWIHPSLVHPSTRPSLHLSSNCSTQPVLVDSSVPQPSQHMPISIF